MGDFMIEGAKVRITPDGMEAYLTLSPPADAQTYELGQVIRFLQSQKVVFGIDEEAVRQMVEAQIYKREICVAKGKPPVNGEDGKIEYKFNTEINSKPKVREDGSVDYWSIHLVETVEVGQIVAVYIEPTAAENGMTVSAKPLLAKRGRPLPPLRGTGFSCLDDGHTYVAELTGKIEVINGGIRISEIYEISGDVGLETGNVDFHGDVIIRGGVAPGAVVKCTGSISVDGVCENCMLDAGKDIVLRGGVLGGNRASIRAGGDIHAKFFEYCQVQATGNIEAESALDSRMVSYEHIYLTGKKASIIGGYAYAASGIQVNTIGNPSEVKTSVHVGVNDEVLKELGDAQKLLQEAEDTVKKITSGLQQYDMMAGERGIDVTHDIRRLALFRTRMIKQAEAASLKKEIDKLEALVEKSKGASISVLHNVYPGTSIRINKCKLAVKEQQTAVQFVQRQENVIMLSLADTLV